MASFSRSKNNRAAALSVLILASALMISYAKARADATAAPSAGATPAAQPDASEELARQIRGDLARIVASDMRIDGVSLGCKPPAGATLKMVAPGITSLTSRSFMVELAEDDRTLFCSASMNASRRLIAAAHDIALDAAVTESDVALAWIDAFSIAPGALASFPTQGPYVAAITIRAGQPLYQNLLKHPIAVHPGELVTVLVKNGPVTVRAQLQAESQASVGETASMINPSSGAPVVVTVTGPRQAELVLE